MGEPAAPRLSTKRSGSVIRIARSKRTATSPRLDTKAQTATRVRLPNPGVEFLRLFVPLTNSSDTRMMAVTRTASTLPQKMNLTLDLRIYSR